MFMFDVAVMKSGVDGGSTKDVETSIEQLLSEEVKGRA